MIINSLPKKGMKIFLEIANLTVHKTWKCFVNETNKEKIFILS